MRPPLPRPPFPLGPRRTRPLPQPAREVRTLPGGDAIACSRLGEDGAPLVVAVHGFRGSDMGLGSVLSPLRGVDVLCPNMPGMGVSEPRPGVAYDLDRLADVVVELLTDLDAGPVVLLGHSFGTVVCSAAASRRPDLVAGLLLLAPIVEPPRGRGLSAVGTDALTLFYRGVARAPREVGMRIIDSKFPGEQSLPLMRRRRGSWERVQRLSHEQLPLSFDRRAVLEAHLASTGHGCAEFAPGLADVPTAIVVGGRDQFTTPRMVAAFADAVRAVHVELVPGAGHLMHYEDTEDVTHAVADALTSLGAATTVA